MSGPRDNEGPQKMHRAVRLREKRSEKWRREGESSIWQNLSMIGALGWLIVVPTLIGVFVGRWLDRMFDSGIFYTGSLIFVGVAFGSWLAWRRVTKS